MRILAIILIAFYSQACAQKKESLDFKIGQMLMVGVSGTDISQNASILEDIKEGNVGGVLLFEKNIAPKSSEGTLKKFISDLSNDAPVTLFVSIDQEGGLVNRLKSKYGFPESVSADYLGELGNLDSTTYYAESTGAILKKLGFNVNFAPVVDIKVKGNPVIAGNKRAYSENPDSIVLHASRVVDAMRSSGVVSVLKHFPGHGSSRADSHHGIADVTKYWTKDELIPYEKMLEMNKIDAVMSAHIVNRELDKSGNPGTLSEEVINGLLRKELGFKGVVFSDDMQMHAITKYYGLEKALELSIMAGIDVLMFSNNIQGSENRTVDTVHDLIKKMVNEGTISEDRIDESYRRIMKLKKDFYE